MRSADAILKEVQYLRKCVVEISKKKNRTEADDECISLERQLQLPIGNSYLLTCNDSKLLRDKEHRAKFVSYIFEKICVRYLCDNYSYALNRVRVFASFQIDCIKRYATPIQNSKKRLKKIYENVFSKSIAAEFNWSGQFGKMPFRDFETIQTINGMDA